MIRVPVCPVSRVLEVTQTHIHIHTHTFTPWRAPAPPGSFYWYEREIAHDRTHRDGVLVWAAFGVRH